MEKSTLSIILHYTSGFQSVVRGPVASTSLGGKLEMPIVRLAPRPLGVDTCSPCFSQPSGGKSDPANVENHGQIQMEGARFSTIYSTSVFLRFLLCVWHQVSGPFCFKEEKGKVPAPNVTHRPGERTEQEKIPRGYSRMVWRALYYT